jgi:hypothetical protein
VQWYLPAKISFFKRFMAGFMEKQIKKAVMNMVDKQKLAQAMGGYKNKLD